MRYSLRLGRDVQLLLVHGVSQDMRGGTGVKVATAGGFPFRRPLIRPGIVSIFVCTITNLPDTRGRRKENDE